MATKPKTAAKATDLQLSAAARSSAQQIWQAGLGAFAKAQEEGGRVLSKLVKEGNELQQRSRKIAEDRAAGMSSSVAELAEGVSRQAAGSWDKLEQIFEERVARALAKMGVPAQQEIAALSRRVEELSRLVADLSAQRAPVAGPAKPAAKVKPAAVAKTAPAQAAQVKAAPVDTAPVKVKPVSKTSAGPVKANPVAAAKAAPKNQAKAKVPRVAQAKTAGTALTQAAPPKPAPKRAAAKGGAKT